MVKITYSKARPRFGDRLHGHLCFPQTIRHNDRCKNNMRSNVGCEGSILLVQSLSGLHSPPTPLSTEIYTDIQKTQSPHLCKYASTWRLYNNMITKGNISNSTRDKSLNTNGSMVSEAWRIPAEKRENKSKLCGPQITVPKKTSLIKKSCFRLNWSFLSWHILCTRT